MKDRPGHDRRYAMDARKVDAELGFAPEETFERGLRKTLRWYLDHPDWWRTILSGPYRDWVRRQCEDRDAPAAPW